MTNPNKPKGDGVLDENKRIAEAPTILNTPGSAPLPDDFLHFLDDQFDGANLGGFSAIGSSVEFPVSVDKNGETSANFMAAVDDAIARGDYEVAMTAIKDVTDKGNDVDYKSIITAMSNSMAESAAEESENVKKDIDRLPVGKRLIAMLGFTGKKVERKKMPADMKAIRLQVPKDKVAEAVKILNSVAYPCNNSGVASKAVSAGAESDVSFDYVISYADVSKVEQLVSGLDGLSTKYKLSVDNSNSSVALYVQGNGVSIVGSSFNEFVFDPNHQVIENTTRYSKKSLAAAANENTELPRAGVCTYLWIDGSFADKWGSDSEDSGKTKELLLQLASLASNKKDRNYTICNYGGGILIVDTAERGGSDLVDIANGLDEVFDGKVNMFAAIGNVVHHDFGEEKLKFSIDTLPSAGDEEGDLDEMKKDMLGGVYLSGNIYEDKADKDGKRRLKGRNGGRFITEAVKVHEINRKMIKPQELYFLQSHVPDVEFQVGGPDKPVGIDDKIDTCNKWIKDPSVQLIEISGQAGDGKSRLMKELKKKYPDAVGLSMSASGKASSMHSLATIMRQFVSHLENRDYSDNIEAEDIDEFKKFAKMNPAEMKRTIQMNPQEVTDLFSRALNGLRDEKNELIIFLDDLHDTDRDSIGYLVKILREVNGEPGVQIIKAGRQDEGEEPLVWSEFKKDIMSQDAYRDMEADGLNFSDEKIAHEYIYHSPGVPVNKGSDVSGDWCKFLARKAGRSPFAMTTCMEFIVSEAEEWANGHDGESPFITENGLITLDPLFFDSVKDSLPEFNDLDGFYAEKIKKLPPAEARAMKCIALLGGSISEAQLNMLRKMFENEGRVGIEMLQKRNYLDLVGGKYEIHHPLMTKIIAKSIDSSEKVELSLQLYKQFEGDETLGDPDVLLGILHNVADKVGFDKDPEFWNTYGQRVSDKYASCEADCARKAAFGTAMQVLDDMDVDADTPMGRLLWDALDGKEIPKDKVNLFVNSLIEVGKNAIVLGKPIEGRKALSILEEIAKEHRFSSEELKEIHKIKFDLEYVSTKSKFRKEEDGPSDLRKIYMKNLGDDSVDMEDIQRAVFELKIAYREMNMEEFGRIKEKYNDEIEANSREGKPFFKEYLEVFHLINCRVPFEVVGMEAAKTMDEDVLMQLGSLTASQKSEMRRISRNLVQLKEMKEDNPGMMSHWSEVMILDLEAQVAAFLGNHEESAKLFSEYWRQVRQMDSGEYTVRGAKLRGDVLVTNALKDKPLDPEKLKLAIEAYSEQGIKYLSEIPKDRFYQFSLRVQRIRAVSLLMEANLAKRERVGMTERALIDFDSEQYLEMAFADFKYINEDPEWGSKEFTQDENKEGNPYYVAGCIWPLINAAVRMNFKNTIPDGIEDWPWMDEESVKKGLAFAPSKKVTNPELDDLGDNSRKEINAGLLLTQFIRPRKAAKKRKNQMPNSISERTVNAVRSITL